jgi:arylsulfatase A-like enzyme
MPRPNIVVVLVDDLRREGISLSGNFLVRTPAIDRLGREGAMFRQMFVTTSLCGPSRASFFTGQYVHHHQIFSNENPNPVDDANLVTFPQHLQRAGYVTGFLGKWHMAPGGHPRPGFDYWCALPGQGRYKDPVLNTNGKEKVHPGYVTDVLTDEALNFIKANQQKPFFLWLAHKAPHEPATPADRHKDMYAHMTPPEMPSARDNLAGKPMLRRPEALGNPHKPEDDNNQLRQYGTMASVDEGVGRIYELLRETGQLDNTIFIFTSDNGYFWGEHGLNAKRAAYEESIGVPLVIRYPKLIAPGTLCSQLALNIDLAPTLLDLAGAPPLPQADGQSWVPFLSKPHAPGREDFLVEYWYEPQFPRIATLEAVRTVKNDIYIHYPGHPEWNEYYQMNADPYQMNNLIADPTHQARIAALEKRRAELVKD